MVRRLVDIFASSVFLLLASPIFLVTALAIWLTDQGPVFYRQTRAGWRGRPFQLLKFRSMKVNHLSPLVVGQVRGEHRMVTRAGRWIRRFKIDELPQLWNVLRGEMSLVGPRPALPQQAETYTEFQRRRLDIRPGATGWAQVNGNIEIPWSERILLDVWYVDHRSVWLDVQILFRTVGVVLFGEKSSPRALEEACAYANRSSWSR
jgi:lipopolysaccharide/colanic/teichoic acid biosynthesis glycosyltransferase